MVFRTGQNDRRDPLTSTFQGSEYVKAVSVGHKQIENQDVRLCSLDNLHGLSAVRGGPSNFEVLLCGQQRAEGFPQHGMVVGNGDPYFLPDEHPAILDAIQCSFTL